MDQMTERLVEYAQALSYEDLPPEVVERTKRLIRGSRAIRAKTHDFIGKKNQ